MRTLWLLFVTHLFTRIMFTLVIGFYNNYALQKDSLWLVSFADKTLAGDFNFDLRRFIVSPLFPILCGFLKFIFNSYWNTVLVVFQITLSAISGVYIFKITMLLFKHKKISLLASLIFAVFPFTLWYVNTFSQECIFQALLIFTIYYLIKSIQQSDIKSVIFSAILFSFTYLTKSHILLFSLFIPLIFYHNFRFTRKAIWFSVIFASISLLFSLPYGLYQLNKNHLYVISSNGYGYQFYLGNTEAGYITIVKVPEKNSEDYEKMKNLNLTAGYFNGSQEHYDSILSLPQNEKHLLFALEAFKWIKENPLKCITLKFYDLLFFLTPGVSFRHYSFNSWLLSVFLTLPVYVFAYFAILRYSFKDFNSNVIIIYLFMAMLLFSTVWYTQNRFRTITLEPFYIIYSSSVFYWLIKKLPYVHRMYEKISSFYLITSNTKIQTAILKRNEFMQTGYPKLQTEPDCGLTRSSINKKISP